MTKMTKISALGQKISAVTQSQFYARDGLIVKHAVKLAVIALFGGVILASSDIAMAGAKTFDSFTKDVTGRTKQTTNVISYISYIGGTVLAAMGVFDLKKHVENPSQTPMKNGVGKLGFGGMLLALPYITSTMSGTIGENTQAKYQKITVNALTD